MESILENAEWKIWHLGALPCGTVLVATAGERGAAPDLRATNS